MAGKAPTISNSLRLARAPLFHDFGQIAEQKFYRMSIEQGWIESSAPSIFVSPIFASSIFASSARLARTDNLVLGGCQLFQCERAAAVQLLGANAHLRAEAELGAIGEAGGCVPIHGS